MSTSITQLCTSDRNAVAPEKLWPYYVLFFFSGFPALLYQIVWQRALFTIYGVNIESVTMIVTVFMLGLGLGSLAGGRLSRTPRVSPLLAFGAIETAIGVFGACSLTIFEHVGRLTAGRSTATTGLMAFALLLVPTMLMGSTLPLLVEHLVRQTQNVGKSVGALYSVNTFGSAAASFAAAYLLMRSLGESNTVRFACALNLIVGTAAIARSLYRADDHPVTRVYGEQAATTARFRMCVVLAGVVGFVALAYEIMWYRLYSFATGG
ncbi:MAG TPA: fused MFS/spermidine synthase, partial [Acidobacteriaceae bacterium]|nr:fused MFS/spermidine synthase [Acidobacteriaceae bacterium]